MFMVNEADAAAIRSAWETGGELSAVVELRRRFPGLADNENARLCAQSIAGWIPPPDMSSGGRKKGRATSPAPAPRGTPP
jgi:hypothetical protein